MLNRAGLSLIAAGILAVSTIAVFAATERSSTAEPDMAMAALGEKLFSDPALSKNATQSCATCHDPESAFVDPREGKAGKAVSVGDDGQSHGDRNTPTLGYASLSPGFHEFAPGRYKGGQFWDGRANDLADQAGQPMLNPVEMAMPDKEAVVERLRANPDYVKSFNAIYGDGALDDVQKAFDNAALALAAFQSTPEFSPFDSKFDRWQRGEVEFTKEEEFGYTVFITWNCRLCHMIQKQNIAPKESFSNFEYHNIGVPVNATAREASGKPDGFIDHGLLDHPGIDDVKQDGKFKVPTLRNISVTGPYMHNGVFEDLRTVVVFYNKYTSFRPHAQINPETGEKWGDPEVEENLSLPELRSGLELSDARVDALVAFLDTLTDARYEPLLEEVKAQRPKPKYAGW